MQQKALNSSKITIDIALEKIGVLQHSLETKKNLRRGRANEQKNDENGNELGQHSFLDYDIMRGNYLNSVLSKIDTDLQNLNVYQDMMVDGNCFSDILNTIEQLADLNIDLKAANKDKEIEGVHSMLISELDNLQNKIPMNFKLPSFFKMFKEAFNFPKQFSLPGIFKTIFNILTCSFKFSRQSFSNVFGLNEINIKKSMQNLRNAIDGFFNEIKSIQKNHTDSQAYEEALKIFFAPIPTPASTPRPSVRFMDKVPGTTTTNQEATPLPSPTPFEKLVDHQ